MSWIEFGFVIVVSLQCEIQVVVDTMVPIFHDGDHANYIFSSENSASCLADNKCYNLNIIDSYSMEMGCAALMEMFFLKENLMECQSSSMMEWEMILINLILLAVVSRVNSVFRVLFHAIRLFY